MTNNNSIFPSITAFLFLFSISIMGCTESPDNSLKKTNQNGVQVISNPEYGIWQDQQEPPFAFELIDSVAIESADDLILGEINAITTDADGNMFVFDEYQHKLLSFAPNGSFRWMTGKEGRGPGDFEHVNDLVTNDKWLVVGNQYGTRMDLFDFDGNYIQSKNIPKEVEFRYFRYADYHGFSNEGNLVISTLNWDGWGHNIYVLALDRDSISVTNHFTIDQSHGVEIPERLNVSTPLTLYGNRIIAGSLTDYSLETYDLQGNLKKTIKRDFDKIIRPGMYHTQKRRSMDFYAMVKSPEIIPGAFWIVPAYWATNVSDPDQRLEQDLEDANIPEVNYRNTVDFYNPEGELLYSKEAEGEFPEIGEISHVDENGIIYVIKNSLNPVILRYKVLTPES